MSPSLNHSTKMLFQVISGAQTSSLDLSNVTCVFRPPLSLIDCNDVLFCSTGCPRLVEAPRTTTMPTSRNVFSDERNNQATSKTNEQIRTDSETPHIDFEWEAYSGGLRNTAGVIPWISLLIKLVSLYMMT